MANGKHEIILGMPFIRDYRLTPDWLDGMPSPLLDIHMNGDVLTIRTSAPDSTSMPGLVKLLNQWHLLQLSSRFSVQACCPHLQHLLQISQPVTDGSIFPPDGKRPTVDCARMPNASIMQKLICGIKLLTGRGFVNQCIRFIPSGVEGVAVGVLVTCLPLQSLQTWLQQWRHVFCTAKHLAGENRHLRSRIAAAPLAWPHFIGAHKCSAVALQEISASQRQTAMPCCMTPCRKRRLWMSALRQLRNMC
jgi:hypothetical protein